MWKKCFFLYTFRSVKLNLATVFSGSSQHAVCWCCPALASAYGAGDVVTFLGHPCPCELTMSGRPGWCDEYASLCQAEEPDYPGQPGVRVPTCHHPASASERCEQIYTVPGSAPSAIGVCADHGPPLSRWGVPHAYTSASATAGPQTPPSAPPLHCSGLCWDQCVEWS